MDYVIKCLALLTENKLKNNLNKSDSDSQDHDFGKLELGIKVDRVKPHRIIKSELGIKLEKELKGNNNIDKKSEFSEKTSDKDHFYFYQESSGQNYYLHPLDIKILKQEYKNYSNFPKSLTVPIINIKEAIMTVVRLISQRIYESALNIYHIYH